MRRCHGFVNRMLRAASTLVLPLAWLLFAQWPLREWVQAGSAQANDLGQILFALYVAVAITAASRAGTHLAALGPARNPAARAPAWRSALLLACVGPWALFLLWVSAPSIASSLGGLEKFGETLTPGYFVIKLALALLLLLVLLDAVAACLRAGRDRS